MPKTNNRNIEQKQAPVVVESTKGLSEMILNDLRIAFENRNKPGNFDAAAESRWSELSREVVSQLNNPDDIKEAKFYLTGEDKLAAEQKLKSIQDSAVGST